MLLQRDEFCLADHVKSDTEEPTPRHAQTEQEVSIAQALIKEIMKANNLSWSKLKIGKNEAPTFDDELPWYEPGTETVCLPASLRDFVMHRR